MNFDKARELMVENQLRPNKITNPELINIFKEIKKEDYLFTELYDLAYVDQDITIKNNRGYLKNLHIAQLIQYSNITKSDTVLHIGGLTGYVSAILSKLSKNITVIEDDDILFNELKNNIIKFNILNINIFKNDLEIGFKDKSPYDIIFIDCPMSHISKEVLGQLNSNSGRLLMIERINEDLSKGIKIIRNNDNYNKEIIFDSFSKFILKPIEKDFIF